MSFKEGVKNLKETTTLHVPQKALEQQPGLLLILLISLMSRTSLEGLQQHSVSFLAFVLNFSLYWLFELQQQEEEQEQNENAADFFVSFEMTLKSIE